MNHEERELFKRVLLDLEARGRQDIADLPPLGGDKLWASLDGRAVADTQLEKLLGSTFVDSGAQWIALPVDRTKTWRPILWVQIDFTGAKPTSLQVVLANLKQPDVALGFRFETPSEAGADGKPGTHHYHHMQLIQHVRPFGAIHGVPLWFPTSFPTFPMDAGTPFSLALCVLLAIYGFGFEETLISQASVRQRLSERYRILGCLGPIPQESGKRKRPRHAKRKGRRR